MKKIIIVSLGILVLLIGIVSANLINFDIFEECSPPNSPNVYNCIILNYELPQGVINWLNNQPQVYTSINHNGNAYILYNQIGSYAGDVVDAFNYKVINIKTQTIDLQGYRIPNDCYIDEGNGQRHSVYFENNQIKLRLNDSRCYEYGYS